MIRLASLAVIGLLVVACQQPAGPAIEIADVRIFAPVPGSDIGVAYLTLTNNGDEPITIDGARSPQFERVEMHETTIEDGVSRMQRLDRVTVGSGDSVRFESGGRHFMLIGARPGTAAGSPVTIELAHGAGLLVVSATMRARLPAE